MLNRVSLEFDVARATDFGVDPLGVNVQPDVARTTDGYVYITQAAEMVFAFDISRSRYFDCSELWQGHLNVDGSMVPQVFATADGQNASSDLYVHGVYDVLLCIDNYFAIASFDELNICRQREFYSFEGFNLKFFLYFWPFSFYSPTPTLSGQ